MAITRTARLDYPKFDYNDPGWGPIVDALFDTLDFQDGQLAVASKEEPSSTLNVKVGDGYFRASTGAIVAYAGTASQAMTTGATNYVYLTDAGVLTVNTTGFPAAFHVPLAVVVTGASTVSSVTDRRPKAAAGGANLNTVYLALAASDGTGVVVVNLGATNGVQFGATGDKVGFLGATPVTQRTFGAATATTTWTTTERDMLQKCYDALRTFGFGS